MAGTENRKRCGWESDDELMTRYHDEEWGVPLHDDRVHFEYLILDGAQAGLSWRTVLHKRENYRRAFADFDPVRVARFTPARIERLLLDPGIIRNRLKVESAVRNARAFLAVRREFGGFDPYIWSFTGGKTIVNNWKSMSELPARSAESDAMSRDLKKRGFNFVGSTICYAYMQAAGMVLDHTSDCFRRKEILSRRLSR